MFRGLRDVEGLGLLMGLGRVYRVWGVELTV